MLFSNTKKYKVLPTICKTAHSPIKYHLVTSNVAEESAVLF